MRLIVFLSKLHRFAILALSLIICSVVGVVDAMSGPDDLSPKNRAIANLVISVNEIAPMCLRSKQNFIGSRVCDEAVRPLLTLSARGGAKRFKIAPLS